MSMTTDRVEKFDGHWLWNHHRAHFGGAGGFSNLPAELRAKWDGWALALSNVLALDAGEAGAVAWAVWNRFDTEMFHADNEAAAVQRCEHFNANPADDAPYRVVPLYAHPPATARVEERKVVEAAVEEREAHRELMALRIPGSSAEAMDHASKRRSAAEKAKREAVDALVAAREAGR